MLSIPSLALAAGDCKHGTTGDYILELSSSTRGGLDAFITSKLQSRSGSTVRRRLPLINALSATLDAATVELLRDDPDVFAITEDCIIQLDPSELARTTQADATWGIDRIDSRYGTDGK